MILQLNPTIPMNTPKGPAHAHFLIDPGQEHHLQFVCFIDQTGECWTFQAKDIRLQDNPTMGRHHQLSSDEAGRIAELVKTTEKYNHPQFR